MPRVVKRNLWFGGAVVGDLNVNTFSEDSLYRANSTGISLIVSGAKNPDLSPDGQTLAIEKYPGYVYICGRNGENLTALSPISGAGYFEPKWFPDGSGVICGHGVGGGVFEYYKIDYPSKTRHQITSDVTIAFKFRGFVASDGLTVVATIGTSINDASIRSFTLPAALGSPMITAADMVTLIPYTTNAPAYDGELDPAMARLTFNRSGQNWSAAADGSNPRALMIGPVSRFDKTSGQVWFHWWGGPVSQQNVGPAPYAQSMYSIDSNGQGLRQEYYCNASESFCVETVMG